MIALPQVAVASTARPAWTGHEITEAFAGCKNGYITQYHGVLLDYKPNQKVEYAFELYNDNTNQWSSVNEHTITVSGSGSYTTPTYYLSVIEVQTGYYSQVQFMGYYPYPIDDGPYYSSTLFCNGGPAIAQTTPLAAKP